MGKRRFQANAKIIHAVPAKDAAEILGITPQQVKALCVDREKHHEEDPKALKCSKPKAGIDSLKIPYGSLLKMVLHNQDDGQIARLQAWRNRGEENDR